MSGLKDKPIKEKTMKLYLDGLEQTEAFAKKLAEAAAGQTITITLGGDLGAGKTAWTRFFGKALGVKRTINSPTFTIMKSYKMADGRTLYHMDAYRLEGAHQDLGFDECFEEGICVVEWADYIKEQIPEDHISIDLQEISETAREADLQAHGPKSEAILKGWNEQ